MKYSVAMTTNVKVINGNTVHPGDLPPAYSQENYSPWAGGYGGEASSTTGNDIPMAYNSEAATDYSVDSDSNWSSAANTFSDKKIRHAFIRKVYLILLVQLSITVGIICLFLFCTPVKEWVQHNSWFYWASYGVFVFTYILLVCVPSVRRRVPANYICLLIFTLAMSYLTATISSYYDTDIVLMTMGITAALCLGITLFAVQTKIDFTMCSALLFTLCLVLFYSGGLCLVLWLCGYSWLMNCLYGGLAAMLFSLFLVYDTQLVVGGKFRKYELSPEDYVAGSIELYLDIVYLFMILLACSNR